MDKSFYAEARQRACRQARAALKHDFVIIDTETTGLDWADDRIVAIGIIDAEGTVLLNTLINPEIHIPEDSTAIHGITNEMVKGAPTFTDIYPQVYAALEGRSWAGYNQIFDSNFIRCECRRANLLIPPQALLSWGHPDHKDWSHDYSHDETDIMHLFAAFYGDYSDYHGSFTWKKLTKACEHLGIRIGRAHHALDDALATLAVWRSLAELD